MKKRLQKPVLILGILIACTGSVQAQCIAGTTSSQLNWDYMDYLINTGNYTGYVTAAQASTQYFMLGPVRTRISASTTNFTLGGENATHTGDLPGFTGQDVQYTPTSDGDSIVITFDSIVAYPTYTLYDIDDNAVLNITARNQVGAPIPVTVTLQAGSILTVSGMATNRTITASSGDQPNNSNAGSATISFPVPPGQNIKTMKIVVTNRGNNPAFWLSDINGCVYQSFPNSYRVVSRPFTGMPAYIPVVRDSVFMLLDPATGKIKDLFIDTSSISFNSLAYDPVARILYYTKNRSGAGGALDPNNREIRKYTVDNETISVVTPNVTTSLNIPTFDVGVESAGASFYNGSYYFGVEGPNGSRNSGRENIIWKIDFDAAFNATRASQVYAARADSFWASRNRLRHDWSDIGVTNGIMYDFDGAAGDSMYYHFDLMTGQRTQFVPSGPGYIKPNQTAIDWQENVYNMGGTGNLGGWAFVVPYNYDGTLDNALMDTVHTSPGIYPAGNWADAAEAFRPLCDFGDAPATYDPDPWSPAVHERDTAIRIGATWDREWNKTGNALATADGADEDGLAYVPFLTPGGGSFLTQVSLYNNTGDTATVIAWLDLNGNGSFDAAEVCQTVTDVAPMPTLQYRWLYWPSAANSFSNGAVTYLRIRFVKKNAGMTNANATGYYDHGETEDYRVLVDNFPLSVNLLAFTAKAESKTLVKLGWTTSGEENFNGFEIQRSADNQNWSSLANIPASGNGRTGNNTYSFDDINPLKGKSYYRLRLVSANQQFRYSEVRTVFIQSGIETIRIAPNPASKQAFVNINSREECTAVISIADAAGRVVFRQTMVLQNGSNAFEIPVHRFSKGIYSLRLLMKEEQYTEKLMIH